MTEKEMNTIFPFIKGKKIKVFYKIGGKPLEMVAEHNTGCYLVEGERFKFKESATIKFIKRIEIVPNG